MSVDAAMTTETATKLPKAKPAKQDEAKVGGVSKVIIYAILVFLTVVFLGPIAFIIFNSFKSKFAI